MFVTCTCILHVTAARRTRCMYRFLFLRILIVLKSYPVFVRLVKSLQDQDVILRNVDFKRSITPSFFRRGGDASLDVMSQG